MLWRRIVVSVVLTVVVALAIFWPSMMAWTYAAGERAEGTVTVCDTFATGSKGEGREKRCKATWTTESGESGEGYIYGLDVDTPDGTRVDLHIGPVGPYAGPVTDQHEYFVHAVILLVLGGLWSARIVRRVASGRATARALLNAPDGTKLVVTRRRARVPGGGVHASLRRAEAPAGYAHPRPNQVDSVEMRLFVDAGWVLGKVYDRKGFAALHDASGRPFLLVALPATPLGKPDYVLVDTSGKARLIITRTAWSPRAYTLTDPDGVPLGAVGAPAGHGPGVLEVTDAEGTRVATAACRGRSWALHTAPSAAPILRDAALVIAFIQHRLGD
ncbi:hypothetical protein AB0L25_02715 [Spirillospora sp. NPDC052242]